MVKIRHKKPECIGCRLCADIAPQYFEMDDEGLAQLINSTPQGVFQIAEGFDEDLDDLEQCQEGCPVDIIYINC